MRTGVNIIACIGVLLCMQGFAQQTRQDVLFNAGWKFHAGDVGGAEQTGFDDKEWRKLNLPHDWSIEMPFSDQWASATGYLPGGIGWYRNSFTAPSSWKNKKVSIRFDGIYNNSEVWINGHYLGKRPNGFVAFSYDLTPYIIAGRNIIAVKADHTKFADSRWYTGSGIYRDVHLRIVHSSHIPEWGVFFTARPVSDFLANASVKVAVVRGQSKKIRIQATLKDASGKRVSDITKNISITQDSVLHTTLLMNIKRPTLWSVDRPYLYSLQVKIFSDGSLSDEWNDEVGIRSFSFNATNGFSLNGSPAELKGVCIHDDAGVLGVAVPEEVWIRRLQLLKNAGCNSIRMAHNPHAEYLYRLCDKMGFLVMDEAFDEWEFGKNKWISGWNKGIPGKDGYHEYFDEWAEKDIEAMVLRNQNRPSVIMWSIGNEVDYPNDPYSHEVLNSGRNPQIYGKGFLPDHPPAARLGDLSARLVKAVKALDTTRPVTAALAGVVMSNTTTYPGNLDIVGYNYQEYRYDSDHLAYPKRIIYGSENGMQYNAWMDVAAKEFIAAQYLWTGIDYMGEAGQWPSRSNGAGLLTLGGFPKPEYYFRQSLWSDSAMLFVGTSAAGRRDEGGNWSQKRAEQNWNRQEGDSVCIRCFSNADEVEVLVNGNSIGRQTKKMAINGVFNWYTVFAAGKVEARAYKDGKQVTSKLLYTTGPAAKIQSAFFTHPLIKDAFSFAQMSVTLVDENGNELYRPGNPITVKVEGGAELVGIENSHLSDTSSYRSDTKPLVNGPLMVYIRRTSERAGYTITISSPGLRSVVHQITPDKKF